MLVVRIHLDLAGEAYLESPVCGAPSASVEGFFGLAKNCATEAARG
jgi:hypothetical protein